MKKLEKTIKNKENKEKKKQKRKKRNCLSTSKEQNLYLHYALHNLKYS